MNKKSSNKKQVRHDEKQKGKSHPSERSGTKDGNEVTGNDEEENESYGGIPARDLKKNLGCGG